MLSIIEWIGFTVSILGPLAGILVAYIMIYENRRAEKFRVKQQKIEELAVLANEIYYMPELKDGEKPHCKINYIALEHMRIINDFYLNEKLLDQINQLNEFVVKIAIHQVRGEMKTEKSNTYEYWNDKQWFKKFNDIGGEITFSVIGIRRKCLEIKKEMEPNKFRTRMKRKIKSIMNK